MITATRISRALGVLGVVGFLTHATASLATSGASYQDPGAASAVDAAPLPAAPEPLKDLPPAPEEPALDLTDLPAAAPAPKEAAPAPKEAAPAEIKAEAPPTAAPAPLPLPAEDPNPLPPARELTSKPLPAAPADPAVEDDRPAPKSPRRAATPRVDPADDPDAHARTFVERNRREAEEQLKALRDEAAQLKGRLARVEAGIRRWEALADALDRSDQDKAAAATGDGPRVVRSRGVVQYGVPVPAPGGVIIQSQPVTRSDFVPVPGPR